MYTPYNFFDKTLIFFWIKNKSILLFLVKNDSIKIDFIWYCLSSNSAALKLCNQEYEDEAVQK